MCRVVTRVEAVGNTRVTLHSPYGMIAMGPEEKCVWLAKRCKVASSGEDAGCTETAQATDGVQSAAATVTARRVVRAVRDIMVEGRAKPEIVTGANSGRRCSESP